ncbi:hypothetical protein B296_00006593 [Ensete ventricosum]|uniref:Uncharacterized protein n=1 Tax=Ensete ventricosum TaxID=4639 RepID=A0A426Y8B4_ENSVE|nr:hypothetical protein B296_00006593 [Ensete ventricosum]
MARDGWTSGISWTCKVNRLTNWERDSSLPWANPKREAVVGFGRALAKKFNSNSFANISNKDIEAGLKRQYQVLAGPLRESLTHQCVGRVIQSNLSVECCDVLCRIAATIIKFEGRESEVGRERFVLYLGGEQGATF